MSKREYKFKTVLVEISTTEHAIYNKPITKERVIGEAMYGEVRQEFLDKLIASGAIDPLEDLNV